MSAIAATIKPVRAGASFFSSSSWLPGFFSPYSCNCFHPSEAFAHKPSLVTKESDEFVRKQKSEVGQCAILIFFSAMQPVGTMPEVSGIPYRKICLIDRRSGIVASRNFDRICDGHEVTFKKLPNIS